MKPRGPNYQKERGERQEARILAACSETALSAKAIAAALNLHISGISIYTRRLMNEPRRMHIAGHASNQAGRSTPLYKTGNLPDVPCIPKRKAKLPDRVETQRNRILTAMSTPKTVKAIAKEIARSTSRTVTYITELRADRLVHIAGWEKPAGRGDLAPIYALGHKRDVRKPRQSRKERYKLEMQDDDRRDHILSQRRARTWKAKAARSPQSWLSALGVPSC